MVIRDFIEELFRMAELAKRVKAIRLGGGVGKSVRRVDCLVEYSLSRLDPKRPNSLYSTRYTESRFVFLRLSIGQYN